VKINNILLPGLPDKEENAFHGEGLFVRETIVDRP